MILNSSLVEQAIDGDRFATFIKEIVLARPRVSTAPEGPPGRADIPLAMVRKRVVRGSAATGDLDTAVGPTKAPVLLLHGYGQNHYAWHLPARSFANYLAAAGYDVFNTICAAMAALVTSVPAPPRTSPSTCAKTYRPPSRRFNDCPRPSRSTSSAIR